MQEGHGSFFLVFIHLFFTKAFKLFNCPGKRLICPGKLSKSFCEYDKHKTVDKFVSVNFGAADLSHIYKNTAQKFKYLLMESLSNL